MSQQPRAITTSQPLPQIGSYRLLETLGSGGMSSVFRAVHEESGLEVAVKILPRSLAKNATTLQRFLREARSAEALEHPNVVAIYDRGTEDGRYYLVLEYVAGGDLHDRVRSRGALPAAEAVAIIQGVARGLQYAAERGVIHRDIKPANILLTPEGEPKVADLGLAIQQDDEDERVTRDGTTVGTVDYMSPEQARDSRATSVRSDIYSLGCTFYHILAGVPPFIGGDVPDKLRRHAFDTPADLRILRPDIPPALAGIVARMLAKKPDQRFADYDELIAALDALPAEGTEGPGSEGPLDAIVVDDEEESKGALDAIVVDDEEDEDDDFLPVGGGPLGSTSEASTIPARPAVGGPAARGPSPVGAAGTGGPPGPVGSTRRRPPSSEHSRPEINLSELAKLDEDAPAVRASPRPRPTPAAPAGPSPMASLLDEEETYAVAGGLPGVRRSVADDDSVQTWIVRGLLIGVAIVLLGFGIMQLMTLELFPPSEGESPGLTAPESTSEAASEVFHVERPGSPPSVLLLASRSWSNGRAPVPHERRIPTEVTY